MIDPSDIIATQEVADMLGLSRQRILQLANEGVITPLVRLQKATLYDRRAIEAYAKTRRSRAKATA
jgi:predicted DNA-binding transcriptional regulator AlpA